MARPRWKAGARASAGGARSRISKNQAGLCSALPCQMGLGPRSRPLEPSPLAPLPSPPALPHRERGTPAQRKTPKGSLPLLPVREGGRGREKRAGVMRVLACLHLVQQLLPLGVELLLGDQPLIEQG